MAHIGFLSQCIMGHIYPMSALALHLKQRGHRVTVFSVIDGAPYYQSIGLDFVAVGLERFPKGHAERDHARLGVLKGQAGVLFTVKMVGNFLDTWFTELPQAIQNRQVDALVIDQIFLGGATVAEHLNIPYVHLAGALLGNAENSCPPINFGWPYKVDRLSKLRNALGLAFIRIVTKSLCQKVNRQRLQWELKPYASLLNEQFARYPQISQEPPSFEFPRHELPSDFHFVGPLHSRTARPQMDFPWEKLNGRPIVYASLGTLQNGLAWIFRTILEACEPLPAQLVLSLGGNFEPSFFSGARGNSIIVKYAPQLELLERATACITHAGLNTTLESLTHGVPMVAIPITNDQPAVAARIEWTGSGKSISPRRLTVGRLRSALQQVLANPAYRDNARRLQAEIAALHPLDHAGDVVESVLPQSLLVHEPAASID